MKKSRIFICSALLSLFAVGSEQLSAQTIFTDVSRSPRERAEDIVKHMTLDEKVALMIYNSPAVERLGIRKYNWWNEALHGVARNGNATVFPMPIGMAASFDTELLEKVFTSISDEGRIKWGIARDANDQDMWYKGLSYWTPNINIFRDPRWGRGMETYGEDPYLTGQLGMAVVRGLQGPRDGETIKAMACAKHYALHSGPEWSRHSFDAVASERDVWETYLPAFKDLVTKAKVDQVMFAYNRIFGFPAGANERFMRDILEKEWGFEGIVVSDCWAVTDFYDGHKWSKNRAEAVATAVKTGMDLECGAAMPSIPKAIKDGLITEEELNEGITKVMEYRYMLGEMDNESEWDNISRDKLCAAEHKALALKMAHESIVLLENDGVLPL
ncbi:MAG: glycoside hydrolase family 3 protein, partial [Alistipes sp.]|nr:glycoside hydrolase family 3 protein [Alistipes sp.]